MNRKNKFRGIAILIALAVSVVATSPAMARKSKEPLPANSPLDSGLLDPTWFGKDLVFVEADEIDYLWVKEGYDFNGKSVRFEGWPKPENFLGKDAKKRDEKDRRLARQMASEMAETWISIWNRRFEGASSASSDNGSIVASGRIVDCSTGSTAAKMLVGFGAGSGSTTIDVKFVDSKSGELVMGIHHRVVSGTTWSTTDSKFVNWIDEVIEEAAEKGFARLYAKGKPVRK